MRKLYFKKIGLLLIAILTLSVINVTSAQTTVCASSFIVISTDAASCSATPTGNCTGSSSANDFRAKIRVFFTTPISIGIATPTITSAFSGLTDLFSNFRFCISGDQGIAVQRTFADYCVYGTSNSGPFPGGNLALTFTSTGLLTSPLCAVLNNIPCPTSFICLSDQSNCAPCNGTHTILTGKIRVFFPAPLAAGVPNPVVTAVADVTGQLNQFKLCASASAATNVERSFVDYCVYTNLAGSVLPTTGLILSLQLQSLSVIQCAVSLTTIPCPSAFAVISTSANCTPCDANFPILSQTIRVFFPTAIPAGVGNPVVTALANGLVTLNQFKLCAVASAATNIDRTFVDYCVYTNIAGSILPNNPLVFTVQLSNCSTPVACAVSPTSELPCVSSSSTQAVTSGPNGAGGTAAGCTDQTTCSGLIVYFASKLRVTFVPCLPAGFAAPTIASFTRTAVDGTVIRYCLQEASSSAILISQQRCFIDYCVYSTLSNDVFFGTNTLPPSSFNVTYTVTVNGTPTPLTQNACAAANSPLPVLLTSFTATRNLSNVNMKWETSTEINNRGFNVQRNAGSGWQTAGFVSSLAQDGNSNLPLSYSYTDVNNLKGITQYRLEQVDRDGKIKYSDIRTVRGIGSTKNLIVYPNPSGDGKINIVFEDQNTIRDVSITDIAGRLVKQVKGVTQNSLTIDNLKNGVYTIQVTNKETSHSSFEKIVINRK